MYGSARAAGTWKTSGVGTRSQGMKNRQATPQTAAGNGEQDHDAGCSTVLSGQQNAHAIIGSADSQRTPATLPARHALLLPRPDRLPGELHPLSIGMGGRDDEESAPGLNRRGSAGPSSTLRFSLQQSRTATRGVDTGVMRRLVAIVGLLAVGLLVPSTAQAAYRVGIGDQHAQSFHDPLFRQLGFRYARLIVPWDALRVPSERASVDAWLANARATGTRPFIAFNHSRIAPRKLPSAAQFRREFRAFRQRYPFVKDFSPWNEINHQSQPTFRKPRAAAGFYNIVRAACRGCTIVAADVLDQAGLEKYLRTFLRVAKGRPRLWGLHNYSDTNRFRTRGTKALLRTVRGQIWLTETGGIVKFADTLPYNERRAARATSFMFRLAGSSSRIKRLYIYSWLGEQRGARFDAGLVGPTSAPRPAYFVVKKELGR